jgi:NAD(P)-dependent dehydrogenase (short-subunit alcohol dehydrogenase family)
MLSTALPGGDPTADLVEVFERVREAVLGGAHHVLVARQIDGPGGPAGLLKTVAAEYPAVRCRAVDVELAMPVDALAGLLRDELHAETGPIEISHAGGGRSTIKLTPSELYADKVPIDLPPDAVVLITGGARGITAQVAIELARRYRCMIELVGRSAEPAPVEDAALATAPDAPALRRYLIETGVTSTSQVEQQVARILADREIRATLAAIRAHGSAVVYHPVDVRHPAFADLIASIYARHGRLDGVIHGAGVLEDKLIRDKTPASFTRVVSTKLAGAYTLGAALRDDVRFVVFFASIAGTFGNRGQVDYAAANDALDKLQYQLMDRFGDRVVSIAWGPWGGAGMVSPTLAREYARRGIALIDITAGVEAMLRELGAGKPDGTAGRIVLSAADPRALLVRAEPGTPPALDPPAPPLPPAPAPEPDA